MIDAPLSELLKYVVVHRSVTEDVGLTEKDVVVHRGGKTFTEKRMVRSGDWPDHPASKRMQSHIESSDLPPEQKAQYHAAMKRVMSRMTQRSLDRVDKNLSKTTFHPTTKDAGIAAVEAAAKVPGMNEKQLAALAQWKEKLASGKTTMGGAYIQNKEAPEMHVDGDFQTPGAKGKRAGDVQTAAGVYAHELGHAIDGPDSVASKSDQWRKAFAAEIDRDDNPLSKYARTNPAEGFAEFSRLVHTEDLEGVEREFPLCAAVWKAAKIWPS